MINLHIEDSVSLNDLGYIEDSGYLLCFYA